MGTVPGLASAESPEDLKNGTLLEEAGTVADETISELGGAVHNLQESVTPSEYGFTGRDLSPASHASADGTVKLDVDDETGSTADEINGIVVWQDEVSGEPYLKMSDYSGFIDVPRYFDLPGGHDYKFNIYINDQLAVSSSWISLSANDWIPVDLSAPNKVPLSVKALYQDGTTPIEDAEIRVKSHEVDQSDGDSVYTWRSGLTGGDGWVNPDDLWLQPPAGGGYYVVEVWKDGTKIGKKQVDSLSSSKSISITTSKAVPQYDISIDVKDGGGSVSVSGSESAYEPGDTVTLEADPDAYYEFDEWEGDYPAGDRTEETITIEMDSDKTLTADFDREEADLSVDVQNANGQQMEEITGIIVWRNGNYNSPYREVHSANGEIDLEMVFNNLPAGHEYLVNAYVQDQHAGSTGTFTISTDGTVSKTIQSETRNYVEVQARWADGDPIGNAKVLIKSHEGTVWRSMETGTEGWTEKLWLYPPDGSDADSYYTIVIKKDGKTLRTVKVEELPSNERYQINTRVDQPQQTLSLSVEGEGSVGVSPSGDQVTDSLSKTYDEGTTVDLTASPEAGHVFSHWSGDYPSGSKTDPSISVPMDMARSITATFRQGTGSVTIDVVDTNGNRAAETNALVIWQDEVGGTPYKKIENYPGISLPNVIEGLPAGHEYLVTAYVQDQYAGSTGWFEIQPGDDISRTIDVNVSKAVTVKALYADGETALKNATVTIKSHSGNPWRSNVTGADGTTIPLWLYPPNKGNYTVIVTKDGTEIGRKTLESLSEQVTVRASVEDTRPSLDEFDAEVMEVNGVTKDSDGVFDLSGGFVTSVTIELTDSDGNPVQGIEPQLSYLNRIEYDVSEVSPGVYEFTHSVGRAGITAFASFYLSLGYDGTNEQQLVKIPINDETEPLPGPIDGWRVNQVQKVVVDGTNYTAVRLTEYPYVPNSPSQVTYVIYDKDGNLVTNDELAGKAAQTAVVAQMMSNEKVWEEWLAEEYPSKMNDMLFWDSVGKIAIAVRDSSAKVLGTLASIVTSGGATTIGGKAVSQMTTRQAMKTAAMEIAKEAAEGLASQYTKAELQANPLKVYKSALRTTARTEMATSATQAKTAGEVLKERPDHKRWTHENAQIVWVATSESMTDGLLWSEVRVQTMPSGGAAEQLKSIGVNFIEGYTGQPAGLAADYTEFAVLVMTGELGSGVRTALKETADRRKRFHRKELTFEELTPETNDVVESSYGTGSDYTTGEERTKSASITVLEEPTGAFQAGDWVNTTVEVTNMGSSPERVFVGYSASTIVNGTPVYYDNEDSTGHYVTIAAGESKTVEVAWQVQSGIPFDTRYDAIVAVWSEHPGQGAMRLDDQVVQDAFTVDSGGGIQVNKLSAPSTVTAGEQVTFEISVENTAPATANRLLNLTNGDAVLERGIAYVDAGNTTTLKLRHTFTEPGTYTLSLAGETTTVSVEPKPESPVASLSADNISVMEGASVSVDATDSWDPDTSNSTLTYNWELVTSPNSASPALPTGPSGEVALTTPGTYTVRVTVSDGNRSDTATVTLEVAADTSNDTESNSKPAVALSVNDTEIDSGGAVRFDASDSTDLDGDTLTYGWDFDGDGSFDDGSGPTVTRSFGETDDQLVMVVVSDGQTTVTESIVITVDGSETDEPQPNEPPVADLTTNSSVVESGDVVVLDASASSDPEGEQLTYSWDVDGDGVIDATGETITWTFTAPGEHPVSVTVSDGNQTANATAMMSVEEQDEQGEVSAAVRLDANGALAVGEPVTITLDGNGPSNASGTLTVGGPNGTTVHQREIDISSSLSQSVDWHPTSDMPSGTYTVKLTVSSDEASANESASVTVDTTLPSPIITEITETNLFAGTDRRFSTGDLRVNGTATSASSVTVLLSAQFTSYRHTTTLTDTVSTWNTTVNTSEIPDDGEYSVTVLARDAAGNLNSTGSTMPLTVDRTPPVLSATFNQTARDTAEISVESDEPLATAPNLSLRRPNGTVETVTLTQASETRWTAPVTTAVSGTYHIQLTGTDQAGNTGRGSANAAVKTNIAIDDQGDITLEGDAGPFVTLEVNDSVSNAYAVVTSSGEFANLSKSFVGVSFLTGEFATTLSSELERATIGIPVNQSRLDQHNLTVADVTIRHYNETTGQWEDMNTTVKDVTLDDGTNGTYWVANVERFSTYGAVIQDTDAPELSLNSPAGDLDRGEDSPTVRFEYGNSLSDVNTTAIELYLNGQEVTDSDRASITSSYATYNASDLEPGEYTAVVRVVDEAGNGQNHSTTFTVVEDTVPPTIDSVSLADGAKLPASTESVTIDVEYSDDLSGVDASAVTVQFDGTDVTAQATVGSSSLSYTATGLSANSSHTVRVVIDDQAGTDSTSKTVSFSINATEDAEDDQSSGGGGGGGGGSEDSGAIVDFTDVSDGATISVRTASLGEVISQDLGQTISSDRMTLETVSFELTFANDQFRLELTEPSTSPTDAPALSDGTGISYFQADAIGLPDSDIDTVTFEFEVGSSALPAGASMDEVVLYRYSDGSWEAMDTSPNGDGSFTATLPGFSTFAIGVESSEQATETATATTATETVTATATDTEAPTPTATMPADTATKTQDSTGIFSPGFSWVVTVLALLISAFLLRRRE